MAAEMVACLQSVGFVSLVVKLYLQRFFYLMYALCPKRPPCYKNMVTETFQCQPKIVKPYAGFCFILKTKKMLTLNIFMFTLCILPGAKKVDMNGFINR